MIISEDHKPLNAYGLTHLLSENICSYYNENTETECVNVRLSNSYGVCLLLKIIIGGLSLMIFVEPHLIKSTLTSDGTLRFHHIKDVVVVLKPY